MYPGNAPPNYWPSCPEVGKGISFLKESIQQAHFATPGKIIESGISVGSVYVGILCLNMGIQTI
jgi:hypothetical protein